MGWAADGRAATHSDLLGRKDDLRREAEAISNSFQQKPLALISPLSLRTQKVFFFPLGRVRVVGDWLYLSS